MAPNTRHGQCTLPNTDFIRGATADSFGTRRMGKQLNMTQSMTKECGSTDTGDGEPCSRTIPEDAEACFMHREDGPPDTLGAPPGNTNALKNSGGAPIENDNAVRHELFSDRDAYYQRLDEDRKAWVYDLTHAILDRVRSTRGEVDLVDRELAKNVAIDLDKAATANEYISRQGLLQDIVVNGDDGPVVLEDAEEHTLLRELRLHNESIIKRLQRLGVLEDPLSQSADATRSLAELLSGSANE